MKKVMLAGVGAALMAIPPADAADLGRPVYKAPPPAVVPFSWTGCYIGGNIGGGWGRETASAPTLARGFPSPVIPAALLAAVRSVAIINSRPIG